MSTRKISIRLPLEIYRWLDGQVGEGETLSGLVGDFLSRFRSGRIIGSITSKEWLHEFIAYGQRQGLGQATVTQALERMLSGAVEHESCRNLRRTARNTN